MLHLRGLGLLELDALTVTGKTLGHNLIEWEGSERRSRFRAILREQDGVDSDTVILSPARSKALGLRSTVAFPRGNLAPEGAVVKSTAIDTSLLDQQGVYQTEGPARVFVREAEAMKALKSGQIREGEVLVLVGIGPSGTGMEETYQVTGALKHVPFGKSIALLTDARFSGVSTGACIGHISPEGLAGGPVGKLVDGDIIRVRIETSSCSGSIDLVGQGTTRFSSGEATRVLALRAPRPDLSPDPALPADTRLWAALQLASGGPWGGCVYDSERIVAALRGGLPPNQ
jgi:dihydroxyacid dehydratase/phosphogluconate dehydratase